MTLQKIITVIGNSSSGKTYFIESVIPLLKTYLNYNVSVIKNVKHHQVDKEGKDSFKFTEAGASYSIIQNFDNATGIFLRRKDNKIESIVNWLEKGPYKTNILFIEGYRNFTYPTVLCASNLDEIEEQLTRYVKMISGIICKNSFDIKQIFKIPIIDIKKKFSRFLEIFNIK